uniref:Uncharacterized protein n=1 Tax=Pristionchus pacificus TaxID=54126 RepID=A0A2A6CUV1_PRIPA|eukprot:PDM81823.1 hypothetical protein PRIPAC_33977 [Pristionchus pacificus]
MVDEEKGATRSKSVVNKQGSDGDTFLGYVSLDRPETPVPLHSLPSRSIVVGGSEDGAGWGHDASGKEGWWNNNSYAISMK